MSSEVAILGLLLLAAIVKANRELDTSRPAETKIVRPRVIYHNHFAIHVPDGPEAAAAIAGKHEFDIVGQVSFRPKYLCVYLQLYLLSSLIC